MWLWDDEKQQKEKGIHMCGLMREKAERKDKPETQKNKFCKE